jgi:peptidoglycan/xylan/chitin deacetylase (PgdA/CDA1 family)
LIIVTFHRVLPPQKLAEYPMPTLAVTPDELAWFLKFFKANFTCLRLTEALARLEAGVAPESDRPDLPLLAVTFDDGALDNFEHARPVLGAVGIPATFFAVTESASAGELPWPDRLAYAVEKCRSRGDAEAAQLIKDVGASPPREGTAAEAVEQAKGLPSRELELLVARAVRVAGPACIPAWDRPMTWAELRCLATEGHEIGSHSRSHPVLTLCDDQQLQQETQLSRDRMEAEIGQDVTSFCYPNGDFDDRVVAALARTGYRSAVTTRWGRNDAATSPFRLFRCDIQGRTARSALGELSAARLAWRLSGLHPGLNP